MNNDFDKYLAIANHDIQVANNMSELKSYVASILYDNDKKVDIIHELEKEYDKEIEKLQNQLQQKENIIKEVREWAKKYSCQFTNDDGELVVSEISFNIQAKPCDLFRILDKVEE